MRRLFAVIGLAGLVVACAMAGSASAAITRAPAPRLTRIERPRTDQLVGRGRVPIVLRTRASLRALRVSVDGHSVKRFLHRSARGYRGVLRLRRGLHYGVNELVVVTRGYRDFDRVRFILARRDRRLLTMNNLRVAGRESPIRVVVRAAPHSTLRAWLNGHRVEHAFQPRAACTWGGSAPTTGRGPGATGSWCSPTGRLAMGGPPSMTWSARRFG
jgi:hypothetical protein